jgi:hypothetical protein
VETSFALSLDGKQVAYDRTGQGPAPILLHGGGGSRQEWHEAGYGAWRFDRGCQCISLPAAARHARTGGQGTASPGEDKEPTEAMLCMESLEHQGLVPDAPEVDRELVPLTTVVGGEPDFTIGQPSVEVTWCARICQQGRGEIVQRIGQTATELGPGTTPVGTVDVRLGVVPTVGIARPSCGRRIPALASIRRKWSVADGDRRPAT